MSGTLAGDRGMKKNRKERLRLLIIAAGALGCSSAALSGTLAATHLPTIPVVYASA
jgi:hypothetical protein